MPSPQNTTSYYNKITPSSPDTNAGENQWGPYTSAAEFDANVAMILIVLLCVLALAVSLNFTIRCLLRRRRRRRSSSPPPLPTTADASDPDKPKESPPTLVFTVGTKMAGTAAECAICLSEFVEGDGVRVMPACNHGFHVNCIEKWLTSKPSCPTCRGSCQRKSPEKTGETTISVGTAV